MHCSDILYPIRWPQNNTSIWWLSFLNLWLCYCLWASSLCQKGAGGRKATPESPRHCSCAAVGSGAPPSPALVTFGPPHKTQTVHIVQCREWLEEHLCRRGWMRFSLTLLKASDLNSRSVSGPYTVIFNNLIYLGSNVFIQSLLDFSLKYKYAVITALLQ